MSLSPDKVSPQAAEMVTVRWNVEAKGGVEDRTFAFRVTDGKEEKVAQEGSSPSWAWAPIASGIYRVKMVVRDALGNASESSWSSEYTVVPKLAVSSFSPDKVSPQAAEMVTIRWKVIATGGVGSYRYEFRTTDGQVERVVQNDALPTWDWSPKVPGTFRVKVVVRDAIGNVVDSGWSSDFLVAQKLKLLAVTPDKAPPQAAGVSTVRWKVEATGGVGEREYSFRSSKEGGETAEQKGPAPTWDWTPRDNGIYRLRVFVRDAIGNTVDSGWSPEYRIDVTAGLQSLIAVMPIENLTGMPIPVDAVRRSLVQSMKQKGLNILGDDVLEKFLERHRIRYTGGLNRDMGKALREETGTNAVLFATLEMFDESNPPKAALAARLVATHGNVDILWMEGVGMAGNDAPGFLLLGLIHDPSVIWENAKSRVLDSLTVYLSGETPRDERRAEKRFAPKSFHGMFPKVPGGKESVSVAVLPFRNDSTRRNAGEILALHFVRELSKTGNIEVVEPGEVRQVLLRSRTIMEGGLSLPQADILRADLDVDLVLTGIVMEYQDSTGGGGNPKVEFSVRIFDMKTRQIVWASTSYNEGDDGVFFFNLGKVNTAHGMASGMARSVVERMDAVLDGRKGQTAIAVPPVSR